MQSSGGVASPEQVVHKPITTALSGPAAGALGSAVIAEIAGFPRRGDARRRRHLDRPLPDRERARPNVTNGGVGRAVPGAHPDDRHRDRRHRRRLDRLDQPRRAPQGRPEERRRRARPDVLPERRRRADHHRRQPGARAHPAGADRRRHRARCRARRVPASRSWRRACPATCRSNSSPTASSRSPTGTRRTPSAR